MAQQQGYIFKHRGAWYLRYRDNFVVDAKIVRKQKCVRLADVCDRYRIASDLDDIVAEKMAGVRQSAKCPHSSDLFPDYVEETYLPFVLRTMKPSTYSAYKTYFERYLKPRTGKCAVRDFTVAIVAGLLRDIAAMHKLNTATVTKIRSILSGIFTYAMSEGHFPARSAADNPASRARIPESATKPKRTVAAKFEEVRGILLALKEMPLARAAVALAAYTGARPSELRGLRWEEWNREQQDIAIKRGVWHRIVGDTKTPQSVRFVAVTSELREILLSLWRSKGEPHEGYILAGPKGRPIILDNLTKRSIVPALSRCAVCKELESAEHDGHEFQRDETLPRWHGFYSLRRFHATQVRMESKSSETAAKALGNTKEVCDNHYIKPETVLPDVRKAVNDAFSGLVH